MPACCTSDKSQPQNPKNPHPTSTTDLQMKGKLWTISKGWLDFADFCASMAAINGDQICPTNWGGEPGVGFFIFSSPRSFFFFLWHSHSLLMKATKINGKTFPRQLWLVELSLCRREKRQSRGFCQGCCSYFTLRAILLAHRLYWSCTRLGTIRGQLCFPILRLSFLDSTINFQLQSTHLLLQVTDQVHYWLKTGEEKGKKKTKKK